MSHPPRGTHFAPFLEGPRAWPVLARNAIPVIGVHALDGSAAVVVFQIWVDGVTALGGMLALQMRAFIHAGTRPHRTLLRELGIPFPGRVRTPGQCLAKCPQKRMTITRDERRAELEVRARAPLGVNVGFSISPYGFLYCYVLSFACGNHAV